MNLATVALDLRPARRLRMSLALVFVARSVLPSRLSFAFHNVHPSDGLKKVDGLPGFATCHQRGADNGNLDVQGHGHLHHMDIEPMKREANPQD